MIFSTAISSSFLCLDTLQNSGFCGENEVILTAEHYLPINIHRKHVFIYTMIAGWNNTTIIVVWTVLKMSPELHGSIKVKAVRQASHSKGNGISVPRHNHDIWKQSPEKTLLMLICRWKKELFVSQWVHQISTQKKNNFELLICGKLFSVGSSALCVCLVVILFIRLLVCLSFCLISTVRC